MKCLNVFPKTCGVRLCVMPWNVSVEWCSGTTKKIVDLYSVIALRCSRPISGCCSELSYYKLTVLISHIEFMYGIFTYIFTYIWLIFYGKSVGKYTVRPMDPAGIGGRKPPPSGCLDSFLCRSISSTVSAIGTKQQNWFQSVGLRPIMRCY